MKKYILGLSLAITSLVYGSESDVSNEFRFPLNDSESLLMRLDSNLDGADDYTEASLFIVHDDDEYWLGNRRILLVCERLRDTLTPALMNKFELHESITQDIGYLLNEWFQNNHDLAIEKYNGYDVWVGLKHYIGVGNSCIGWIYIWDDEVFFKVTPFYTASGFDPYTGEYYSAKDHDNVVPYEQWILDYRPCLVRKLSRDTARQWLEQVSCILKRIEENMKTVAQEESMRAIEEDLSDI